MYSKLVILILIELICHVTIRGCGIFFTDRNKVADSNTDNILYWDKENLFIVKLTWKLLNRIKCLFFMFFRRGGEVIKYANILCDTVINL